MTTFVSASQATKYAVASTSGASRSVVASTVTGSGVLRGQRLERAREPALREDSRVDAVRELAQLLDRDLELVGRRREQLVDLGVCFRAELALRAPELERQRHEPLLRAVMEIALDPAALLVRRGDDARPRLLHRLELRPDLGMEARVHEREARRGGDRLDELRLLAQRRVVDEHGQRLALVLDPGHRARRARPREPRAPVPPRRRIRRARVARARARASDRRARQRELVADPVDGRLLEMDDELADVDAGKARAQEPPEQRERERDEREDLPPEEVLVGDRGRVVAKVRMPSKTARSAAATAAMQERREDPARPRRRAHELPRRRGR